MTARFVPVPTPESGTYWEKAAAGELWLPRCESCGKAIAPARLEAKPAARYCIDCASRR